MSAVRRHRFAALVLGASMVGAVIAACTSVGATPPPQVPGGNPQMGVEAITAHGCGACHMIPGVKGANGLVGPPLIHWSRRGFIAGQLQNNGDDLIRWLLDPQAVEPNTDMPNTGLSPTEARDIAAYLFTLK